MTYNPNIPQANQLISASQLPIQTNFAIIDDPTVGFGVNHVQLTAATNQGRHTKIDFTQQPAGPGPGSLATQLCLFQQASNPPGGTNSELFFQRDGVAAITQLTGGGITSGAWCQFNGNTAGTNPPTEGFNVTSVKRNNPGDYTLNFTRNFATSNYSAQVLPNFNIGTGYIIELIRNVNNLTIKIRRNSVLTDTSDISVLIFGTLA